MAMAELCLCRRRRPVPGRCGAGPCCQRRDVDGQLGPVGLQIAHVNARDPEGPDAETAFRCWPGTVTAASGRTGRGNSFGYEQGRAVATRLLATAFTGNHGWFWRTRTDAPATATLRTRDGFSEMRVP